MEVTKHFINIIFIKTIIPGLMAQYDLTMSSMEDLLKFCVILVSLNLF